MTFELSIINGKTVNDIVRAHRPECMDVVKHAYLAHARGQAINPHSYFLRFPEKPDSRIIALPAFLGDGFAVAGLKWIASYPGNVRKGFPRASAVLILNDYETGYPFAILESAGLSAARTAASAALAAYWLNGRSRKAQSLGIVGTGLDRKSTRLNSSHPSISYAVFCLKKKKYTTSRLARAPKTRCPNGASRSSGFEPRVDGGRPRSQIIPGGSAASAANRASAGAGYAL